METQEGTSGGFVEVVEHLGHGQTLPALDRMLAEVAREVARIGGKGELVLTLSLKKAGDGTVQVADKIKATVPQPSRGDAVFFAGREGGLYRQDPRQRNLALVPGPGNGDVGDDDSKGA